MLLRTCDFGGGRGAHCPKPVMYEVSGLDVPNGHHLDTCNDHIASAVRALHIEASASRKLSEQLTLHFFNISASPS